jgi:hypothetical protein
MIVEALPPIQVSLLASIFKTHDDAPIPAGQRCFRYVVSPSGAVQVTGPSLLGRVFPLDYRAKYADGTALSGEPKDSELDHGATGRPFIQV